jgi:hypothetical protein
VAQRVLECWGDRGKGGHGRAWALRWQEVAGTTNIGKSRTVHGNRSDGVRTDED